MSSIIFIYVGLFSINIYGGSCGNNVIFGVAFINVDVYERDDNRWCDESNVSLLVFSVVCLDYFFVKYVLGVLVIL